METGNPVSAGCACTRAQAAASIFNDRNYDSPQRHAPAAADVLLDCAGPWRADRNCPVALHWGMTEEQEQEFTCSFCGKGPQELRSLFRGPEANICGECVRRLYDMLDEADDPQSLQ
ncbi:ClpX C4-type zinc finger protein [Nevskia soli]|uniref:ClpX C4-type zinc finger protein n=1 Tax=Nevskia soli TaxID=418856 RepID=UPI0004A7072E|nr:ClpX C4-type zinc finger protein [Nevskia soli]